MRTAPAFRRIHARSAFTLLELVLVMVILGLLASVAAYNLVGTADKARVNATKQSMEVIKAALKDFYFEKGAYPTTAEGLQALVSTGKLEKMPLDGWKRPFEYVSPGQAGRPYDIISLGKDALPDTADDIRSWELDAR